MEEWGRSEEGREGVADLVEVGLVVEDEAVDGDEDLEEVGAGVPLLTPLPAPRPQQTHAHLPVQVQVRVQLLRTVRSARGGTGMALSRVQGAEGREPVVDEGRHVGILVGELDVEEEEAVVEGGVDGPGHEAGEEVHPVLVAFHDEAGREGAAEDLHLVPEGVVPEPTQTLRI